MYAVFDPCTQRDRYRRRRFLATAATIVIEDAAKTVSLSSAILSAIFILTSQAPTFVVITWMITLRTELNSAVYCNRSCLRVCNGRAGGRSVCVCGSVTMITRNCVCIDPHQTGFVGKGSDHLQLFKFWPSRAPGKGAAAGRRFFAPP